MDFLALIGVGHSQRHTRLWSFCGLSSTSVRQADDHSPVNRGSEGQGLKVWCRHIAKGGFPNTFIFPCFLFEDAGKAEHFPYEF